MTVDISPSAPYGVYLASKFARHEELSGYAAELRAEGVPVTARWFDTHGGPDCELDDPRMSRYAEEDVEDVAAADTIVSFTAGGGGRGGRHVEFGMGVALGKRAIVVGPVEHVFHTLPQVERVDTWDEAKALLVAAYARAEAEDTRG